MTKYISFLYTLFSVSISFLGWGQNYTLSTVNGSTINSGTYSCGVSQLTANTTDGTDQWVCICAAPGEVVVIDFTSVTLNNPGGTNSDDVLYVYSGCGTGGTILYQDGTGSTGTLAIVSGSATGGCVTIRLDDNSAGATSFSATIGCLPAANAGSDQSPADCSTTTVLSANDVSPATGTWSVTPSSGVSFSNINDPNASVTGLTPGTSYTFTWTSSMGGASNSDQMMFNSVGPGCQTYCTPSPGYSLNTVGHISNVNINLGVVNQTSGWNGGLNNYTATCVPLTQGVNYPFSFTFTYNGAYPAYRNAFIDWNGNGVFEASEIIPLGNGTSTITVPIDISIPCDAVIGDIRMRVVFQYNSDPLNPCITTGSYGETEDYCLTILPATPPVANAGLDQIPLCTSSATLDASLSTPLEGYWSLVNGSGTITDPTNPNSTVTGMGNGTNVFQWTSVGTCVTDIDEIEITVSGLPDEPVSAGDDVFTCQPVILQGSNPAPYTGQWVLTWGPNVPAFTNINDPNAEISGMINGFYTLEWQVNTASCGVLTDVVTINYGFLPVPNAGTDQTVCPTGTVLAANEFSGAVGTWSIASQPVGSSAGFVDINDPETLIYGLIPGAYTLNWSVSGGGCPGGTSDAVTITVNNCSNPVLHDPVSDQSFTGCNYTYTDDGGAGSDYSANISQTWTTFCPDDPDAYATLTFNSATFGPGDYLVVYDSPGAGAPIVGAYFYDNSPGGGLVANPPTGTTITSSTGCLYVQMNSTATYNYAGWTSTVGCAPTAGTQNQDFVTVNQCGGGGGITLCQSGVIPAVSNMETNPPDLGSANSGCLGSQEGASNTWVYINVESDGYIAFSIDPAGGQDFDYAIWGPYPGGYACPGATLDEPIRCSWAANGGSSCDAVIGLGIINTLNNTVLATDVSEGGFCNPSSNEGWTYPIEATAGEVYVLLFQNYSFNNSTFDVTINDDPSLIPPGATYADLGCNPPQPLPIQLIDFGGEYLNRENHLYWTTASEYANQLFTIERSKDGKNWSAIAIVPGAGFSSERRSYSAIDQSPLQGINYYRLVQTDFDGTKRSYKTIAIATEMVTEDWFGPIFPNPTSDEFYFLYGGKDFENPIHAKVYSSTGQLLISHVFDGFNATESLKVNTVSLSNGFYHVEIEQNGQRTIQKLLIQD